MKYIIISLSFITVLSKIFMLNFEDPRINNLEFNNIHVSQITQNSAVFESLTRYPIICMVEIVEKNDPTNTQVLTHSKMEHENHIIQAKELTSHTEYSFRFLTLINEQHVYSDWMSFQTVK